MLRRVSLLLSVISEFYNLEHWYLLIIYFNEGPWKSISRWRHFTTRPTICIYDQNPLKFRLIVQLIKGRRSVTSHYHGSKIIFLKSDGHFHCRAMKEKWKSKVLFLSAIMHRKVIKAFFFSLRYLHGNVLVMTSPPYSVFCYFQGKTKRILVVVVKWRHRANGLWIKVSTKKIELKGRLQHRGSIDVL